jgi:hypothetical protein
LATILSAATPAFAAHAPSRTSAGYWPVAINDLGPIVAGEQIKPRN